jgi:hypothetical protein
MKTVPVKRYPAPSYPTRELLETDPGLLRECPNRWKEKAVLVAMLTAAPGLIWGADEKPAKSSVAPLFKHGKGETRAFHGTSFSILPVLLSEDDARQVIDEQLKKAGLDMSTGKKAKHDVEIVLTHPRTKVKSKKTASLTMDGSNAKHNVAYEFISATDEKTLGGSDIHVAESVRGALDKNGAPGTNAIFYDPAVMMESGMMHSGNKVLFLQPCKRFPDSTLMPLGLFDNNRYGLSTRVVVAGNTVTVTYGTKKLVMTIGAEKASLNGKAVKLPTPTVERDGVVYAPVRVVAESLGLKLTWDPKAGRVSISGLVHVGNHSPDGVTTKKRFAERQFKCYVSTAKGDEKEGQTYAFLGYDSKACIALTKAESKRLLRLQVRDFVAWLKAQGAI